MPRMIALALLLTTLPLAAQDIQPAPAKTPKPTLPTGRITGTILCADTHRPARGATIMVSPVSGTEGAAPFMTHVALDGTYTVEHVVPATYIVIAALPGYLSPIDTVVTMDHHSSASLRKLVADVGSVTVTGGETETFDITLERGAALSGRVFYSDGAPATRITLSVEDVNAKAITDKKKQSAQAAAQMFASTFAQQNMDTDDQGRFRIAGLKPGTYRVVAISSTPSYSQSQDDDGSAYEAFVVGGAFDRSALRVYSGDTLHSKTAKTYDLRAGDEVSGIDITIPLNAFHQVRGTLTAVDGRPINQATLTLTDTADDTVTFESHPAEDGAFIFPTVTAGTYTLTAKDARIMAPEPGPHGKVPTRFPTSHATNAFADNSTSLIVKDSDLPDVSLTLTEVPLPPQPAPAPNQALPDNEP